jgi:hypothetical protein
MAFVSQELKSKLAPKIKAICKKYKVKASLAVNNHSTLVLNIQSSPIDFIKNFNETIDSRGSVYHANSFSPAEKSIQVNPYWYQDHFSGKAKAFLSEVLPAMNDGNFDKSDIQSDYFHVGWYVSVNIGKWNKPYEVVA